MYYITIKNNVIFKELKKCQISYLKSFPWRSTYLTVVVVGLTPIWVPSSNFTHISPLDSWKWTEQFWLYMSMYGNWSVIQIFLTDLLALAFTKKYQFTCDAHPMSLTKTLRNTVDLRSWVLLPWLDVGLTLFNLSLCRVEVGLMLPRRSAICWALSVWSWESSVSLEAEEGSTHSVTVLTTVPSNDDI